MPRKNGKSKLQSSSNSTNQLRIIGGHWRGRKLSFPSQKGLRPTSDRIRETLFNWLGQNLSGFHAIDLFAGSGALGFEALSRGAESVVFVEVASEPCHHLSKSIELLNPAEIDAKATVHQQTAQVFLQSASKHSSNLLFLDPPFSENIHNQTIEMILESELLTPEALIYIESPREMLLDIPHSWRVFRKKTTGNLCYQILET